ncbi:MAG: hypothetical protein IH892_21190 [Planctomycetes bacterium]|nr:hypothetical protein [Planctomycetota bacterium]
MIEVTISPLCQKIMDLLEIDRAMLVTTVNERHRGLVNPGVTRIAAVHWFSDTQIIFADTFITNRDIDKSINRVYIREVTAHVVLDLQADLPGGSIDREMRMEEILEIIAASFGEPVTCHPQHKAMTLYSGPWNGTTIIVNVEGEATIGVCGSFSREECSADRVWAFNLERYREWFVGS